MPLFINDGAMDPLHITQVVHTSTSRPAGEDGTIMMILFLAMKQATLMLRLSQAK
jgi:hypothetical protein